MLGCFPFEAVSGCSHREAWACCTVSLATPTRSSLKASRSVSSLSLAEKASSVFAASYFLRLEATVDIGLKSLSQPPHLITSLNQLTPLHTSVSGQQVLLRVFSIISDPALSSGFPLVPVGLQ
jgi:hypothetical protein